jgi:hypothetical protein
VPAGYPPPDFFQQSVGWIDENGNPIRYLAVYHNGFPKPAVSRRGGAAYSSSVSFFRRLPNVQASPMLSR